MCDDRVVYLSMDTRNDYGSYWMDQTVKVLFDFERGTLYTVNSPWRVGSPDNQKSRAITEGEFANILKGVAGECQHTNSEGSHPISSTLNK